MAETIQRRKLYQEVHDRLMERIRSGAIAPGAQLPSERELMEIYGVGRPAIREALQTLERSGIVEIVHGERARVVVPTAERLIAQIAGGAMHLLRIQPDMLEHLKSARLFLETGTARMAAENASEEDVARLQLKVAQQRASMVNLDEFIERDMAFHREIAHISGNPIFPSIVESLFRWANEYYRPLVRAPGAEELTLAEHQRIVDAIGRGDGEGAAEAMRAHLTRANELYKTLIHT
ncbi:transcriptional regulator NanR [Paraburkholderia aromaticivorans]|uniref:transcriptional regulator NanR n=1 Tax=Paraburkholderia aromaticivorans TaxID=2026199 RepID=UPI0038B901F1